MLVDLATAAAKIRSGETFFLAGDESLLRSLPKGRWIGGSIPYFMDQDGGIMSKQSVFLTQAPAAAFGGRPHFPK